MEEHVLLPDSQVKLQLGQARSIILKQGTLRARQIEPSLPKWSIQADGDLNLRGDSSSDFIVSQSKVKGGAVVTIIVLRGQVRLDIPASAKNNKSPTTCISRGISNADLSRSNIFGT